MNAISNHQGSLFSTASGSRLILLSATALALGFCIWLSNQNHLLLRQARFGDVSLSGPAQAVVGDVVPSFVPYKAGRAAARIQYGDESACRLFLIFSASCSASQAQERLWLPRLAVEAERSSIELLRVSIDEVKKTIPPGSNETKLTTPTLFFPEYALRRAYRVTAIPEILLVSPAGRISWVHYGVLDDGRFLELKQAISRCRAGIPSAREELILKLTETRVAAEM